MMGKLYQVLLVEEKKPALSLWMVNILDPLNESCVHPIFQKDGFQVNDFLPSKEIGDNRLSFRARLLRVPLMGNPFPKPPLSL